MPASFFAIEPESSSTDACFGQPYINLETTPCLKRWLSCNNDYLGFLLTTAM